VHSYYTFIALDLARERSEQAERYRLLVDDDWTERPERSIRRSVAGAVGAVGRAVDRLARRIDQNVTDALVSSGLLGRSRS
jgi:hypothetical protein